MASSSLNWSDPRLIIFMTWAIFSFLFLCIPNKRYIARIILRRLGIPCQFLGEEEPREARFWGDDLHYDYLSDERKLEIDRLRAIALRRRLSKFTMTLKQENMVKRTLSEYLHDISSNTSNDPANSHESLNSEESGSDLGEIPPGREEPKSSLNDVENGNNGKSTRDPLRTDDKTRETVEELRDALGDAEGEFTHVVLPQPGRGGHCTRVNEPLTSTSTLGKKKGRKRKNAILVKEKEEKKQEEAKAEKEVAVEEVDGVDHNRNVPIFCSICLLEYKIAERVSWSSNLKCTHAFHEDCAVEWFVSLGRTKSKMQRFSKNPSDSQLLNYELECPCCRQEFLFKAATPKRVGEENV